jgi:hypothetical protein
LGFDRSINTDTQTALEDFVRAAEGGSNSSAS